MTAIWLAFFGGLSGSPHCLGMCGPFALHWAGGGRSVAAQLLWHAGRITVYTFLGFLAGFAGSRVLALPYAGSIGLVLSCLAAFVMLLSALSLMGWMPVSRGQSGLSGLLAPILRGMLHEKSLAAPAATGILCGFLPCPMTLGFLALAVASSRPATGGAIMAALGAGTLIPLLLLGLSGKLVLPKLGRFARPVGAVILVVLAATTILRPMNVAPACPSCAADRVPPVARPTDSCPTCAGDRVQPAAFPTHQVARPAEHPSESTPSTCPCPAANTAACP